MQGFITDWLHIFRPWAVRDTLGERYAAFFVHVCLC